MTDDAGEQDLRSFGNAIQRLIGKQDLEEGETYRLFRDILTDSQPDLQQGAFLAALVAKGETAAEIVGTWRAILELDTVMVDGLPPDRVENSGTGMDTLKTFNVSSAAAIVASACGATLTRHGARALTSFCGTVDILESVGIDVECEASVVRNSILAEGIGLFNGMSPNVHPRALGRILSQIRFGSTLNIAASLANPACPELAVRGVYSEDLVDLLAEVMPGTGYRRGMVVHGRDARIPGGMDELSVTGESVVREFATGGPGERYTLVPDDVGLRLWSYDEIAATGDATRERRRFVQVLAGTGHPACVDFTCFNAGAVLYVGGIRPDLQSAVTRCREAVENGAAIRKLARWVSCQNTDADRGFARLNAALRDAEVEVSHAGF